MAEIILDIGSGRSLHNIHGSEKMISDVAKYDSQRHKLTFKSQLFQSAPPNIPLDHDTFDHLYHYARERDYEMTASVFDKDSLEFLLRYDIPFVKIACRPDLYWLIGEVPRKIPVYASWCDEWPDLCDVPMACIRKYPASVSDYYDKFDDEDIKVVSDHTEGWELFRRANPRIIEKHLCPEREEDNPDSGPFAVTPEELRDIIA